MGDEMNGCMLPGRTTSWSGAVGVGFTTETEGTAICAVTTRSFVAASTRERIPAASTPIIMNATAAAITQRLPDRNRQTLLGEAGVNVSLFARVSMCVIGVTNVLAGLVAIDPIALPCRTMQHAEERGYK